MTEATAAIRRLLKEQGLTDEEIEKKLCTPVYDESGSSIFFGRKRLKKESNKSPVYDQSGSSILFGRKKKIDKK